MPITGAQLLTPDGPLPPEVLADLRPGVAPGVAAEEYATRGNTKTEEWIDPDRADRGAFAWALTLIYEARALQLLTAPTGASGAGEGSVSYSAVQATTFIDLAAAQRALFDAEAKAEADALLGEEEVAATTSPPARSRSTPTRPTY